MDWWVVRALYTVSDRDARRGGGLAGKRVADEPTGVDRKCKTASLATLAGCREYVGNDPPKREQELRELAVEVGDGRNVIIEIWLLLLSIR